MGLQDEVGEFYDQELFGGRAVSVRFVVSEISSSYVEHQAKVNLLEGLDVLLGRVGDSALHAPTEVIGGTGPKGLL